MPAGKLFRFGAQTTYPAPDLAPDTPFWAIGDVHGRYDLLAPLLDRLMGGSDPVVLLGDYINKGPDSARVLRLLQQATATGQVIALRGNHEDLLLKYLVRPRVLNDTFLGYGGTATLTSFGVSHSPPLLDLREMSRVRNDLRQALGDLEDWISGLPCVHRTGNVAAMHAGANPQSHIDRQFPPSFCWGHPEFDKAPPKDGLWVIHGHKSVASVTVKDRRVAVNTLAGTGGCISAVRVARGGLSLL
jgi:serine/threonine protein phosphatase 1